jgi:hypothetical protein
MLDVVRRQVAPPSPTFVDDTLSEIEGFLDTDATQNAAFLDEEGLLQKRLPATVAWVRDRSAK